MKFKMLMVSFVVLIPFLTAQVYSAEEKVKKSRYEITKGRKQKLKEKNNKLSYRVYDMMGRKKLGKHVRRKGDKVILVVENEERNIENLKRKLLSSGCEVIEANSGLIKIAIHKENIESLNKIRAKFRVRLPYKFFPSAIEGEEIGLIGVTNLKNVDGSGVKIGIIDIGFIGLSAAEVAGEITNVKYTFDYTGNGFQTEYSHGTSVTEIVHEIAPGAELYLYKILDEFHFESAASNCISRNVDIILSAINSPATPGNGTGRICDVVNDADSNGILWVNSMGNQAERNWWGAFNITNIVITNSGGVPIGTNQVHKFNTTGIINPIAKSFGLGEDIEIYLTWDDPYTYATNDYDLYLYATTSTSTPWTEITNSMQPQSFSSNSHPLEIIEYTTTNNTPMWYGVRVDRWYGEDRDIKIISRIDEFNENIEARSIVPPADADSSFSVAAIGVGDWGSGDVQPYSSHGPTVDGGQKPDISGVDDSTNYSDGRFTGTSAAAASVAGAAAILWQVYPSADNDEIKTLLRNNAIDVGSPGYDYESGYGKVNLLFMTNAAIEISKSISNVTLQGVPAVDPVPGSVVEYKISCSNKGPGLGNSIILLDELPEKSIYITNVFLSGMTGWTLEFSTNSSPNNSYSSSDFLDWYTMMTNFQWRTNLKWLRYKKASIPVSETGDVVYRILVK